MIKVKYNSQTTLIEGYFPSFINYPNNVIDIENKTIDGSPYIEISNEEHQASFEKEMRVIDGVFQEYVKPDSQKLIEGKAIKKAQCLAYLQQTDWYITRMSDPSSATIVPENILINRTNARVWQNDIEQTQTLEELENINIHF
jgi:hypothetical protein